MCPSAESGQSSQPPTWSRHWRDIPVEALRAFMQELVRAYGLRGVEANWGIRRETLRRFVQYDPERGFGTEVPQPRQRREYGELFLAFNPQGFVLERKADGSPGEIPPLKAVLPPGEENAEAGIEALFKRVREHPEGMPEGMGPVEGWLKKILRAQYAMEERYPPREDPQDT